VDGAPSDPRCHPLIELDLPAVEAMLAPVLRGAGVRGIAPVEGGLTNTVVRVTADDGTERALRVYAGGRAAFERETRLLRRLAGALPVPDLLLADDGATGGPPYVVYRWIGGITLNECRLQAPPAALATLAEPLGRLLARLASFPVDEHDPPLEAIRISTRLAEADERLRAGLARSRLGGPLADGLRERLAAGARRLEALDGDPGLVHGDFGGRNILVRAAGARRWEVSGVLDWESAATGAAPWDVGHLFRYPRRYSPAFRAAFARGYRAAGGTLPRDWWRLSRLLDATNLVATLDEARELPGVFPACREVIASLVRDGVARATERAEA
jgi:aminoglycoside phosphotransferase (APT) family kinase protein